MEEYFDIYTINREPTGKKGVRGQDLKKNEYHIVVMAIIMNKYGEVLITKRSNNKIAGGKWECTSGSALAGESSKEAVIREIKEELGVTVTIEEEKPISYFVLDDAIWDIWVVKANIDIIDVKLQHEEVDEAKYVNLEEITNMIKSRIATKTIEKMVSLHKKGFIKIANK